MSKGSPRARGRRQVDGNRRRALPGALAITCAFAVSAATACSLFLDFDITGGTDDLAPGDAAVDRVLYEPSVLQPDAEVQDETPFDDALPPPIPPGETLQCSIEFKLCDSFEDEDPLLADLGRWTANTPADTVTFPLNESPGKGLRSLAVTTTAGGTLDVVPLYTHPSGQAQRVDISLDLHVDYDKESFAEDDVVTLLSLQPFAELRFDEPDRPRTEVLVTAAGVLVRSRSFNGNDREKQVTLRELDERDWIRLRIVSTFKRRAEGTALHVFVDDQQRGTRDFASLSAPSSGAVSLAVGAKQTSGAPRSVKAWIDNVAVRAL